MTSPLIDKSFPGRLRRIERDIRELFRRQARTGGGGGGGSVTFGVPAGTILPWASDTLPDFALWAEGQDVSRETYATLFAAIGTTWGAGNGSTTFTLPDMRGLTLVGRDTGQSEFDALGKEGGAKTHTLSQAEMPSHNHGGSTSTAGSHTHQSRGYYSNASGTVGQRMAISRYTVSGDPLDTNSLQAAGNHSHTITSQGGGGAHNNLQPYVVVRYIITTAQADLPSDSLLAQRVGALEAATGDTGWVTLAREPGINGTVRYRMSGAFVAVYVDVDGTFPSTEFLISSALPPVTWPIGSIQTTASWLDGAGPSSKGIGFVNAAGDIRHGRADGTSTRIRFTLTYIAGA